MIITLFLFATFDYTLNTKITFFYDDNIFEYAPQQLQEFMTGRAPEKYPFETYDDLGTNYEWQLLLRNRFVSSRITTLNFNFSGYSYLINEQKNYFLITAGIRQSLSRWSLKLEYLLIPYYLIRYYREPEGTRYRGCQFKEHLLTFKIKRQSDKFTAGTQLGYEIDDYTANFDVYDSRAIRIEPFFNYLLSRIGNLELHYEYKSLHAQGPIPDISYQQHRVRVISGLNFAFPRLSRISFEYQLKERLFTTEIDPYLDAPHSGRIDLTHMFKLHYQFPIFTSLRLFFYYHYEFRRAHSEVYPEIGLYKNYNRWVAGSGLEFSY